jgi:cytochrome P450
MDTAFNYPQEIKGWKKISSLIRTINYPLETFNKNHLFAGDNYCITSASSEKKIIFSQDKEFFEYVLKQNHKNYSQSETGTITIEKYWGKGLLLNTGKDWLKQRRLMQSGFSKTKIVNLVSIMEEEIDKSFTLFENQKEVDMYSFFHTLAFKIVSKTLFSSDIDENTVNKIIRIITELMEVVVKEVRLPFYKKIIRLTGALEKNIEKSKELKGIFQTILDKRRKSSEEKNDLLDMLIQARYEDTQLPMTDIQLIDEMLIIFFAGHETVTNALSFIFFEISQNPEAEKKLKQEISDEGDLAFTSDSLIKKSFTTNIIKESMRLHSPAWVIERKALADDQFKEYSWKKSTHVVLYISGLHRNPKYWEQPNTFIPERFNDENLKNGAYYPFGAGPKLCIGDHFAMMEMALVVRKFYKKFTFTSYQSRLNKKALLTLRPVKLKGKITKNP